MIKIEIDKPFPHTTILNQLTGNYLGTSVENPYKIYSSIQYMENNLREKKKASLSEKIQHS